MEKSSKKILMISGFGATDIVRSKRGAFYNTLSELSKHFQRIDVIAPGGKWFPKLYPKTVIFENVHIHPSILPLWLHPLYVFAKGIEIYHASQYDLVVVHEYFPFYNGMGAQLLWRRFKNIPQIFEIFHIVGYPNPANLKERIYRYLIKMLIGLDTAKAKAIRVMNKKETPEFLESAGIPQEKLLTIPAIYVDLQVFKPANIQKIYDAILVGRLASNKGIELLIEAVKVAKQKKNDLRVLIVGDGPLKEKIRDDIDSAGLDQSILLHGYAQDSREVARLMNMAKVLIIPSYNEGGPRVVLEAMACGLGILTTKVGLMHDIIQDGNNGYFIDWDPMDIADKMIDVIDNHQILLRFSQEGIALAGRFEKSKAIKNYANKIKELTM